MDEAGNHHSQQTIARTKNQTLDRKSTRLNSSHLVISYAVFCLKKKNNNLFSAMPLKQGWGAGVRIIAGAPRRADVAVMVFLRSLTGVDRTVTDVNKHC